MRTHPDRKPVPDLPESGRPKHLRVAAFRPQLAPAEFAGQTDGAPSAGAAPDVAGALRLDGRSPRPPKSCHHASQQYRGPIPRRRPTPDPWRNRQTHPSQIPAVRRGFPPGLGPSHRCIPLIRPWLEPIRPPTSQHAQSLRPIHPDARHRSQPPHPATERPPQPIHPAIHPPSRPKRPPIRQTAPALQKHPEPSHAAPEPPARPRRPIRASQPEVPLVQLRARVIQPPDRSNQLPAGPNWLIRPNQLTVQLIRPNGQPIRSARTSRSRHQPPRGSPRWNRCRPDVWCSRCCRRRG